MVIQLKSLKTIGLRYKKIKLKIPEIIELPREKGLFLFVFLLSSTYQAGTFKLECANSKEMQKHKHHICVDMPRFQFCIVCDNQ